METLHITSDNGQLPGFATIVVHEVRNPLTTIKLAVKMIAAQAKDPDIEKFLDIITKSSQRIDDLVSELLKPTSGNKDFKEPVSLHQLLNEVIHEAGDRLLLKEIELTKEYDREEIEISVSKAQLKIAFTNLIINAIDAMAPQTGKLRLVTTATDSNYTLQIEDNGCGIKPGHLNDIFKPYFTNKPDGLGLGLTATQKILNANNVEIMVGSKLGSGTVFTLLFKISGGESKRYGGMTLVQTDTSG